MRLYHWVYSAECADQLLGSLVSLTVLDDLIEPLIIYIGLDLRPDRKMVRKLKAELLASIVLARK